MMVLLKSIKELSFISNKMNNKKYEIADRKDYSVFVIPEKISVYDYLRKNYPFEVNDKNIYLIKNKKSCICYLFNENTNSKNKILSSRYIINRYDDFTGKLYFKGKTFIELIELNNGELVSSELMNSVLPNIKMLSSEEIKSVSKNDLFYKPNKNEIVRRIFLTILLLSLFISCVIYITTKVKMNNESFIAHQKEMELLERNKLEEQKIKTKYFLDLRSKYENKLIVQNVEMYPIINLIYSNFTNDCIIENLSIQRTNFQIDITTKNAIEVLSKFEINPYIEKIQMNRTASSFGYDHVSFSGKIKRTLKMPEDDESLESKILFYEKILAEPYRELVFSEYVKNIRLYILMNKCKEEFLQVKNVNNQIDLECELKGSGVNILKLIRSFDTNESKIEIKSLRIRNTNNLSTCSLSIVFETFIDTNSVKKDELKNINIKESSPNEIGIVFNARKESFNSIRENETKQKDNTLAKSKKLKEIGTLDLLGKGSNKDYEKIIFVKNSVTGEIFKIPVVNSKITKNYALENNDCYNVFINNEEYKVNK